MARDDAVKWRRTGTQRGACDPHVVECLNVHDVDTTSPSMSTLEGCFEPTISSTTRGRSRGVGPLWMVAAVDGDGEF